MKKRFVVLLVVPAIALGACGGGTMGGTTPTISRPTPTSRPQTYVSVSEQRSSVSAAVRTDVATCGATPAPIVVAADANYNPPHGSTGSVSWQIIRATEYDASCNTMAAQATYTSQDPRVAAIGLPSAAPSPQPAASPGSAFISGGIPGSANVVASFPDGTTTNIAVSAYSELEWSCDSSVNDYLGQQFGLTQYSGDVWNDSVGEVQESCYGRTVIQPPTADVRDQGFQISFAYGYSIANSNAKPSDFSNLLTCPSIPNVADLTANNMPANPFIVVFKTHDGLCVKAYVTQQSLIGVNPMFAKAYYAISDSSGRFPY